VTALRGRLLPGLPGPAAPSSGCRRGARAGQLLPARRSTARPVSFPPDQAQRNNQVLRHKAGAPACRV